MAPKEKARDLINKFSLKVLDTHLGGSNRRVIDCALIAVNEIIKTDMLIDEDTFVMKPSYLEYWMEVKQELEKLKI